VTTTRESSRSPRSWLWWSASSSSKVWNEITSKRLNQIANFFHQSAIRPCGYLHTKNQQLNLITIIENPAALPLADFLPKIRPEFNNSSSLLHTNYPTLWLLHTIIQLLHTTQFCHKTVTLTSDSAAPHSSFDWITLLVIPVTSCDNSHSVK
jgi:hypothetical protein